MVAVGKLAVGNRGSDAERNNIVGERLQDLLGLSLGGVPNGQGLDDNVLGADEPNNHGTGIDHGGQQLNELSGDERVVLWCSGGSK